MIFFDKIINKIEKRLEINLRYFSKNLSYMFANNIITIVLAMALSIMLARVLSKDVFGQYNFIISIFGLISILSMSGMNTSLTRSCAKGFEGSFKEATKSRIRWGSIGSFVLFIIGLYYYIEGSFSLSFGFMVTAIFFISYFSFRTFYGYLLGKKRFKSWSLYLSSVVIVVNISTVIIAYYFRNLIIIILVLLGISSLMNAIFLLKTLKESRNDKIDKETIPYGKHLTLVNSVSIIKSHLDKIIIGFLLGFEALAIYSVAVTIPRQIKPIWSIITNIIFPDISRKSKKDAYSAIKKRFKYIILLGVIIIIIGIIIIPPIISYFYSEKYIEAIFYAQLLMISTIGGTSIILVNLATAQKKLNHIYKISIIPPIIYIVLLFLLTLLYGLMGTALAAIIGIGFIPLIFSWFVLFGKKEGI